MNSNKKARFNNRVFIPQGLNCKLHHPVDYDYACGMVFMNKPWNNTKTCNVLLEDHRKTIRAFHEMVSNNELQTHVVAQCILAVNYI